MNGAAAVERLRLKFPGAPALTFRDLSFSVSKGERVLLLGPSGCGKSTLLQVLTGLIPNAVDIPMTADKVVVPERWAYVFQDPDTQFCMPYVDEELAFVLENLLVPRDRMRERIESLLERVGLSLESIHTPIAALSQGMKQRLAIACALALEPDVLFLDEPTALLDPDGTRRIWETIRAEAEGRTIVIVEHKIGEIVDFIDRVVLFNGSGEITADGPAGNVFAEHGNRLVEDGIWYPGVWDDYDRRSGRQSGAGLRLPSGPDRPEPMLRLEMFDVCRGKETKLHVERADVSAGEWIAVVGPNGAGKSTLLLGLMQLLKTGGGYELNGKPVDRRRSLSDDIAFVFQNPEFQFVTNSVYDEIAFSLRKEKRPQAEVAAKTEELLEAFDLAGRRDNHPFQLSLGQKRRLSVASAIVKEQRLLLLDEPTFGQDARNTFALLERLESWRSRGTAIVMVTHDPDIVRRFATRVWEVRDGELKADLSPAEWTVRFDAEKEAQSFTGAHGNGEDPVEAGAAAGSGGSAGRKEEPGRCL